MIEYSAFLRGINVGGRNRVAMKELVAMAQELGLEAPRTYVQSGNLKFRSGRPLCDLEQALREKTKQTFDLDIEYFVRTQADLEQIVLNNPFREFAESDPAHLLVCFLHEPIDLDAFRAKIPGNEVAEQIGRELFLCMPDGIGTSKLRMPKTCTGRNWNTILKMIDL